MITNETEKSSKIFPKTIGFGEDSYSVDWIQILNTLKGLADVQEIILTTKFSKRVLLATDPQHVAMIQLSLPDNIQPSYWPANDDESITLGNIDDLHKSMKQWPKIINKITLVLEYESVEYPDRGFTFDQVKSAHWHIESPNGIQDINQKCEQNRNNDGTISVPRMPTLPAQKFVNTFFVRSDLLDFLKYARSSLSDTISLHSHNIEWKSRERFPEGKTPVLPENKTVLTFSAKGENASAQCVVACDMDLENLDEQISLYPMYYFPEMLKVCKDNEITVGFSHDYPIQIEHVSVLGLRTTLLIAPRIEND